MVIGQLLIGCYSPLFFFWTEQMILSPFFQEKYTHTHKHTHMNRQVRYVENTETHNCKDEIWFLSAMSTKALDIVIYVYTCS